MSEPQASVNKVTRSREEESLIFWTSCSAGCCDLPWLVTPGAKKLNAVIEFSRSLPRGLTPSREQPSIRITWEEVCSWIGLRGLIRTWQREHQITSSQKRY